MSRFRAKACVSFRWCLHDKGLRRVVPANIRTAPHLPTEGVPNRTTGGKGGGGGWGGLRPPNV